MLVSSEASAGLESRAMARLPGVHGPYPTGRKARCDHFRQSPGVVLQIPMSGLVIEAIKPPWWTFE